LKENATCHKVAQSYDSEDRVAAREDQEDVEKVLAGDISAFERIVLRWQRPLINLAYRFCRDHGRAEDLAQEAFLRIYRGLSSWRKDAAFSTWLFSVATNCYRSELRRIPQVVQPIDVVLAMAGSESASFDAAERHDAVRQAVLALPSRYREALTLFYFHEMDISSAAQSLGLPEGTLKARLSRGRKILQRKLPQFLGELRLREAQ
jgi:RNA polymerase sigma-70 factor, ECF subfamily